MAELRLTECFLVSAAALASLAEGGGLASLCSLDLSHMSAMQSLRVRTHLKSLELPPPACTSSARLPGSCCFAGGQFHPFLQSDSPSCPGCVHHRALLTLAQTLCEYDLVSQPIMDSA